MMVMGCGSKNAPSGGTDSAIDSGDGGTTGGDDSGTNGTDDSGTDTAEAASIARGEEIVQDVCSHCHDPGALAKRAADLDDDTITFRDRKRFRIDAGPESRCSSRSPT
jgi:mono/diheme cytochrome c family protein